MTYTTDLPRILAYLERSGTIEIERRAAQFAIVGRWRVDKLIRNAAEKAGANYIDILETLCRGGICQVLSDNNDPMAFDSSHFTKDGANTIVRMLKDENKLIESSHQ